MSYAYVNPLLALMLGAALGGERVDARVAIAIALILPAVIAIVTRPRPAAASAPAAAEP